MKQLIFIIILLLCSLEQGRSQVTVNVNARSNIFAAGKNRASAPAGGGGGLLPYELMLKEGVEWINFTEVVGVISFIGPHYVGPDGEEGYINIEPFGGLSGIYHPNNNKCLLGVFLDDKVPSGKWPYSNDLYNDHLENRPELNRIFFIGDGLTETGKGDLQKFIVPDGATRLFLGFADAFWFTGPHGWFDDNKGSLKATIELHGKNGLVSTKLPLKDEVYNIVQSELDLRADTSKHFILDLVQKECENEYECLFEVYTFLSSSFEGDFNFSLSYFINEEIIRLCKNQKDYKNLIDKYKEQIRYASFLNVIDSTSLTQFVEEKDSIDLSKDIFLELGYLQNYFIGEKSVFEGEKGRIESEKEIYYLLVIISFLSLALMTVGVLYLQKNKKQLALQNKKISEQAARLKNIDETKSRFFANISHELRTPLTLIHGPLNTIMNAPDLSSEISKLAHLAQENTSNLQRLVDSILDLSKIEAGKMVLNEEPMQLFNFSRRILSGFESHARANGVQLTFEFFGEENLTLELDLEKVETILNNLLSNAIKFSDSKGHVSVTIADRKKDILFIVNDTGRGISKTDLPYIFNRYFQTEVPNAPKEGGTGIGLAFSKELVELMNGKIWVESDLGVGTTFFVELPRKEVFGAFDKEINLISKDKESLLTNTYPSEHIVKEPAEKGLDKTILLVEDNSSLQDYIRFTLADQFHLEVVGNGQEALDYLYNSYKTKAVLRPDLIMSDLMMPVMDGFQFVEKLKADTKFNQIPVIMLTARADVRDKLQALRIGVDDYLLKPFNEEELKVRIVNLLNNHASRASIDLDENDGPETLPEFSGEDLEWLADFEDYIKANYTQQILNIPKIAYDMAMSESSLLRKLKQLTGLSPAKYLQEVRLEKAMTYLNNKTYNSVAKVALEVGYSDARTFSRNFKSRYGKSPSQYLRQ